MKSCDAEDSGWFSWLLSRSFPGSLLVMFYVCINIFWPSIWGFHEASEVHVFMGMDLHEYIDPEMKQNHTLISSSQQQNFDHLRIKGSKIDFLSRCTACGIRESSVMINIQTRWSNSWGFFYESSIAWLPTPGASGSRILTAFRIVKTRKKLAEWWYYNWGRDWNGV